MKKLALAIASLWFVFVAPAFAANVNIDGLPAATSVAGADLLECEQSGVNNKCTSAQMAAYVYGLMSGDATAGGTGAVTLKTVNSNVGSFGSASQCTAFTTNGKGLITAASAVTCTPAIASLTGLGTGVAAAAANNLSAAGGLTSTIAAGATAMGTSAIASAACATVVTATATNTATTDVVTASFNGDPTAVTGYVPSTNGMLTIFVYPTSGNVNFKVCNNTGASITPGAITLNWRVVR
jgi:hypothetical protein